MRNQFKSNLTLCGSILISFNLTYNHNKFIFKSRFFNIFFFTITSLYLDNIFVRLLQSPPVSEVSCGADNLSFNLHVLNYLVTQILAWKNIADTLKFKYSTEKKLLSHFCLSLQWSSNFSWCFFFFHFLKSTLTCQLLRT